LGLGRMLASQTLGVGETAFFGGIADPGQPFNETAVLMPCVSDKRLRPEVGFHPKKSILSGS